MYKAYTKRAYIYHFSRKIHLWLGIAIGIQVFIWLASGLFMTWFPIETVRGEHLRSEITQQTLTWPDTHISMQEAIRASDMPALSVSATMLQDIPIWRVQGADGTALIDATNGKRLTPLSEALASKIAAHTYSGAGDLQQANLLSDPPREYGRPGPVWRIEFGPQDAASFYVDASTGEVCAVRTTLWRVFDFMWGLHIMDWSTRENFNSWWIKMTASMAVLFALAGIVLTILRLSSLVRKKRR
jgi:hypothetical protein